MIALMMVTFILLFTFVVNTGLLINAKINLQNAADLAAYAGAAAQARQLNSVAFLNYDMRRQYKKFLFRYYVIGNMAQKSHPGQGDARRWSPDGTANNNYGVPAVCMIFNPNDNYCQLSELPSIPQIQGNPLDAISQVLSQQLASLEKLRQDNCEIIGETNKSTLAYWLYNTDPSLQALQRQLAQAQQQGGAVYNTLQTLMTLARGMGLVPRLILHEARIRSLEEYLNTPSFTGLTREQVDQLASSADAARYERSVLAFRSAYETLGSGDGGGHLFNGDDLLIDELMPAQLARFEKIQTSFQSYFVQFDKSAATGCKPQIMQVPTNNLPVGVYKDPTLMTYYAIRARAKVNLMFPRIRDLELKAYSAAQPFGSRVGPRDEQGLGFVLLGARPPQRFSPPTFGCFPDCRIPNLPLRADEPADGGVAQGWNHPQTIAVYYNAGFAGLQAANQPVGGSDLERAYRIAMAPNPFEIGLYSIPAQLPGQPLNREDFERYFGGDGKLRIWAPVFGSAGGAADIENEIQRLTDAAGNLPADIKTALTQALKEYIQKLQNCEGENGECLNVVALENPLDLPFDDPAAALPPETHLARDPAKLRSAWADVRHESLPDLGRTGYSVKYVSFKTLTSGSGITTDGGGTSPVNLLIPDGEGEQDFPHLGH